VKNLNQVVNSAAGSDSPPNDVHERDADQIGSYPLVGVSVTVARRS
jgi:hypothetical protein